VHGGEKLLIWEVDNDEESAAKVVDMVDFVKEYQSRISSTIIWRDGVEENVNSNCLMVRLVFVAGFS
jgi:hypothetical protein